MEFTLKATSSRRRRAREQQRARQVRLLVVVLLAGASLVAGAAFAVALKDDDDESSPPTLAADVQLLSDGETVASMPQERALKLGAGDGRLPLDLREKARDGDLVQIVGIDEAELRRRLGASAPGGAVEVPQRTVASRLDLPIFQQAFQNNCETAALSMLLDSVGVEQDQLDLQDQIVKADPLDPETNAEGQRIWGDPNQGFVGRVDGGGPAGGFGAFQGPVAELASRWAEPIDLTERPASEIYDRLLAGQAVMVWIGLSDGPYATWLTPGGEEVTVNYGEHTVVLTGLDGDRVYVNDPIDGQKKVWSRAEFEAKWALLDRRALALQPSQS